MSFTLHMLCFHKTLPNMTQRGRKTRATQDPNYSWKVLQVLNITMHFLRMHHTRMASA